MPDDRSADTSEAVIGLLGEVVVEFIELMWRVLPYFFVGIVAAAALKAFVPERWAQRAFGRGRRSSLLAAVGAGAVLPGCSCTTMPMASGLSRSGGPALGTVAAFIFVSPLLSPITVVLTAVLLGWRITVARIVACLFGSLVFGLILNRFEYRFASPPHSALPTIAGGAPSVIEDECCTEPTPQAHKLGAFGESMWETVRSIGPHFLIGMVAAAALSALLPEAAIPRFLGGSSGPAAYALAVIVGIPMYVCEGEEVPITYALLGAGLGQGPAFAFLLGSVGTCVPTMLMSRSIIGTRATFAYIAYWVVFAIGSGLALQVVLS